MIRTVNAGGQLEPPLNLQARRRGEPAAGREACFGRSQLLVTALVTHARKWCRFKRLGVALRNRGHPFLHPAVAKPNGGVPLSSPPRTNGSKPRPVWRSACVAPRVK